MQQPLTKSPDGVSLRIVPTPIGNLGDITLRAIQTLREVDTILAEDTRTSGILLKHLEIKKPMLSFHNFNEHKAVTGIIKKMQDGEVFALISDAGTPGISDPGFLIVRACLDAGLKIECLPGPVAFVPALVKSGLPTDRFSFEGFLPVKKGRKTLMEKLAQEERTIVLYESPHRILKTLEQLIVHLGDSRKASLSRELSKLYEETVNGTLQSLLSHFTASPPRGEIVLVVAGKNYA